MKISTSQFFDNASQLLVKSQQRLNTVQEQLSTGKKVNNASDDPSQAAVLQRLRTLITQQESYKANLSSLQDRLQNQDTTLSNAQNLVIRLRELSIQMANGTMSAQTRASAAIEVRGLRDQLLSLANAKDSNGYGLFAGGKVSGDAFVSIPELDPDGEPVIDSNGNPVMTIRYVGDQNTNQIPVGDTRVVSNRRSGTDVFTTINVDGEAVGFFESIDRFVDSLESNDAIGIQAAIGQMSELQQNLANAQAGVGSDLTIVDSQGKVLDEQLLRLKGLQSQKQDLDYAETISKMQKEMLSLQAAQGSFAQISKLSLFNYIN